MLTINKGTKRVSIKPSCNFANQGGGAKDFFRSYQGGANNFSGGLEGGAEDFLRLKRKARSLFFRFQLLGPLSNYLSHEMLLCLDQNLINFI